MHIFDAIRIFYSRMFLSNLIPSLIAVFHLFLLKVVNEKRNPTFTYYKLDLQTLYISQINIPCISLGPETHEQFRSHSCISLNRTYNDMLHQ